MINVSEITGAWIIPYGIDIGNTFWDIINQTGLFLIPFFLTLGTCVIKARAMGRDEGAPSVLFIKMIEKKWIAMFFCMMLFVMPVDINSDLVPDSMTVDGQSVTFTPINFKAYSCRKYESSILGENGSTANVNPNLPFTQDLNYNLPVAFGAANQIIQGFVQSLNASVPCDPSLDVTTLLGKTVTFSTNGDEDIDYTIGKFVDSCYIKALNVLKEAAAYGSYNDNLPLTEEQKYITSTQLIKAYGGGLTTKTGGMSDELNMLYDSDRWKGSTAGDPIDNDEDVDGDSNEDTTIGCLEAARSIYTLVSEELDDNYSDMMTIAKASQTSYKNKDGGYDSSTDVVDKYVQQFVMDVAGNTESFMSVYYSVNSSYYANMDSHLIGGAIARVSTLAKQLENNIANYTISVITPIMSTCLIAILFACAPIILTLSGFSLMVATTLLYLLFFLISMNYILDIGWYIENVILNAAASYNGVYSTDSGVTNGTVGTNILTLMPYVQSTIVPTLMATWSIFAGLLGVTIVPVMSQLLNSTASSVGSAGTALAMFVVKAAARAVLL